MLSVLSGCVGHMHVIVCYQCATRCSDNMILYVVAVDIVLPSVVYCVIVCCCYLPPLVYCVILCVIMVDVGLGTLSIPIVYCVISVIMCYCVLSWWMASLVLFPSLVTCVIVCYRVLSCVIVCYHGGCRPFYSFHPHGNTDNT